MQPFGGAVARLEAFHLAVLQKRLENTVVFIAGMRRTLIFGIVFEASALMVPDVITRNISLLKISDQKNETNCFAPILCARVCVGVSCRYIIES